MEYFEMDAQSVQSHFNFPKFHSLQHYVRSIQTHGSIDGYNSESSERSHIDMAKNAYRATNKRKYIVQMTSWQYRLDAVITRDNYIQWAPTSGSSTVHRPTRADIAQLQLAKRPSYTSQGLMAFLPKHPSLSSASISTLVTRFYTTNFLPAFHSFLEVNRHLSRQLTEYQRVDVYCRADLRVDPGMDPYARELEDCLHATPASLTNPEEEPGNFSTVLVRKHLENELEFGMESK